MEVAFFGRRFDRPPLKIQPGERHWLRKWFQEWPRVRAVVPGTEIATRRFPFPLCGAENYCRIEAREMTDVIVSVKGVRFSRGAVKNVMAWFSIPAW